MWKTLWKMWITICKGGNGDVLRKLNWLEARANVAHDYWATLLKTDSRDSAVVQLW